MDLTCIGIGSRGDVQPLVALAAGLAAAGYRVQFATQEDFAPLVRSVGLEYYRLSGQSERFYSGRAGIAMRERARNPKEFQRFTDNYLGLFIRRHLKECWQAAQGSDAVLCWPWTRIGPSLAEKLGIPCIVLSVNPVPLIPTREFPNPFHGKFRPRLGPLYNRFTWWRAQATARTAQAQVDRWRREVLELPPLDWRSELRTLRSFPHLFGYSPLVLPRPRDWADWIHVTGYWFLDRPSDYEPPEDLQDFLAAGPPPVAVGFGSHMVLRPEVLTRLVVEAVERSRRRAVLISGWGRLKKDDLPENIFPVETVPYDWLLPRTAGVVHHGGSGSTAAGLRAGVPTLVVPFGYEQPLWGHRLEALGVGPPPIAAEELTVQNLAQAITRLADDEDLRCRARDLGAAIRAEDGVARAVDLIAVSLRN